jgi:hypothetical protein
LPPLAPSLASRQLLKPPHPPPHPKRSQISRRRHLELLEGDQLLRQARLGSVFVGLAEGPVTFLPTYKFEKGGRGWGWGWERGYRQELVGRICVSGNGRFYLV